jgi:hypothetical protein
MTMSDAESRPPLNPEPPSPPGEDIEAPDIRVDTPDNRDRPDGTDVSATAGAEEAPD